MQKERGKRKRTHSRRITQLILLPGQNFPQDPPHDLAAASLGEICDDVDRFGRCEGPDALADLEDEFLAESFGRLVAVLERDECVHCLAGQFISHTDHGRLGNGVVLDQRRLDLGRRQAVAANVDHIVHTSSDPVEAFVVTSCTVTREL